MNSKNVQLLLVILSAHLGGIHGIDCFTCSYSNMLPDYVAFCNDPFDWSSAESGDSSVSSSCNGVCSKASIVSGNTTSVSRECLPNTIVSQCDNACKTVDDVPICHYCCDTDRCNSASSVTFNLLVSVAMLFFVWTSCS